MSEILGKVTGSIELPRGADVSLRISVPRLWLFEGRSIEIELPRNLVCGNCSGGGCGRCQQSGAITVRGRDELPEMVQVCLPEQGNVSTQQSIREIALRDGIASNPSSDVPVATTNVRPLTIRIPECGGLPDAKSHATVRGWLLLHVGIADEPSSNVRLLDDEDPLSSSKMTRAEAKRVPPSSPEASPLSDANFAAADPYSPSETPPSVRMAKVRSVRASDPKSLKRASQERDGQPPLSVNPVQPKVSWRPGWAEWLWVVVIVVAIVWLWLWYWR